MLSSLNNLSLSVNAFDNDGNSQAGNEGGSNTANDGGAAEGERNQSGDERKVPAVYNLNVTLIKSDEKRREGGGDGGNTVVKRISTGERIIAVLPACKYN